MLTIGPVNKRCRHHAAWTAGHLTSGICGTGKWVAFAHLIHITIRLAQNWGFKMEDPSEKMVWPRFEPHPENGLMLLRS